MVPAPDVVWELVVVVVLVWLVPVVAPEVGCVAVAAGAAAVPGAVVVAVPGAAVAAVPGVAVVVVPDVPLNLFLAPSSPCWVYVIVSAIPCLALAMKP